MMKSGLGVGNQQRALAKRKPVRPLAPNGVEKAHRRPVSASEGLAPCLTLPRVCDAVAGVISDEVGNVSEVKWIPIDQLEPKEEGDYLIFVPTADELRPIILVIPWTERIGFGLMGAFKATHWAYLPEPPITSRDNAKRKEDER
jgi:hypothetical protein